MNRSYAGIGARATPRDIQDVMTAVARKLEAEDWLLRSGGAAGADQAFERGVTNPAAMQIFLPNERPFQGHIPGQRPHWINYQSMPGAAQAMATVNQFHPTPQRLTDPYHRHLHARNAMQVLGPALNDPSKFIVAWTPGGQIKGGTGQALRLAQAYGIPVRNLGNPQTLRNVLHWLG